MAVLAPLQRPVSGGPPILLGGTTPAGPIAYSINQQVVNITFTAGTNTATVSVTGIPTTHPLLMLLKRKKQGPPILGQVVLPDVGSASVAYALAGTTKNITFTAGTNTKFVGRRLTHATKNITFGAGANTKLVSRVLVHTKKNVTFAAGVNTKSVGRALAHTTKNILFLAGSNTATPHLRAPENVLQLRPGVISGWVHTDRDYYRPY